MSESRRILAFLAAAQLAIALALPPLERVLLRLAPEEAQVVMFALWALVPLSVVVGFAVLRRSLRDVDRARAVTATAAERADARQRVLRLPSRLTKILLGVGLGDVAGLLTALVWFRLSSAAPLGRVVGIVLCTAPLVALPTVPLYAFARLTLLPLALKLGDDRAAEGRRISLALGLGYSLAVLGAATVIPAAIFGAAQLDEAHARSGRTRAQLAGLRLAAAVSHMEVGPATTFLSRVPLPSGQRTLVHAPSGTLVPEEAVPELSGLPYVEIPLDGALRGGSVRVVYDPERHDRTPLWIITILLLSVTLGAAIYIGTALARDLGGLTERIDRVARDEEPGPLYAPAISEVERVTVAANRLLERVPRFTVESFLAIERADEAQRLKSQFLANMSHDLRSPLNSILGFSELLLRGIEGPITPRQIEQLNIVSERGHQLLRQLNEILDTAKAESGRMELHRQTTPPAELLRAAIQEARRGRPSALADQLTVTLQPGLRPIYADPLRVTQALTHLLNHGFEAAPGEKILLRAKESEEQGARYLIIELEYDREVSTEDTESMFQGFSRRAGKNGLHLALPLARRLAELHGGTLDLVGELPARLRLRLPTNVKL